MAQLDPTLVSCVLDLALRQPTIPESTAFHLLRSLPDPNTNRHLWKALLLRLLRSDLSFSSISAHRTLTSLDYLRRLDHPKPPTSLISAFDALHNTLFGKLPTESPVGYRGLTAEESKTAALRSLRKYVEEAWEEMGPSFLEIKAREYLERETNELDERRREHESRVEGEWRELDEFERAEASCLGLVGLDRERARRALERGLGDGIADVGRRAAAQAARPAEGLASLATMPSKEPEQGGNNAADNACSTHKSVDGIDIGQTAEAPPSVKIRDRSLPNIMERNPTAHTSEWHSIDSPQGSPDSAKGVCSSLRKRSASSLKMPFVTKSIKRRKMHKWSSHEEETLRGAVNKYGKGNWKFILNCYPSIFIQRTEVDLKDKWRNMSKHL